METGELDMDALIKETLDGRALRLVNACHSAAQSVLATALEQGDHDGRHHQDALKDDSRVHLVLTFTVVARNIPPSHPACPLKAAVR